ncbi:hypothetical protein P879_04028 [Paragonimus westermani]|uniref:Uncharacterized protein n=1 Tax=Paragonimus westermani TaxID=34504 RepID=A0A8T0DK95_9TREM|nr:hypothetical protein P879_04028 [Paragonimus westermani]
MNKPSHKPTPFRLSEFKNPVALLALSLLLGLSSFRTGLPVTLHLHTFSFLTNAPHPERAGSLLEHRVHLPKMLPSLRIPVLFWQCLTAIRYDPDRLPC